jgi:hypothetical protein
VIARIASTIVPQPAIGVSVERWQTAILPRYLSSQGLILVCLLQRPLVAYIELMTVSVWTTQEELDQFLQRGPGIVVPERSDDIIQLEARAYDVIVFQAGSAFTRDH